MIEVTDVMGKNSRGWRVRDAEDVSYHIGWSGENSLKGCYLR